MSSEPEGDPRWKRAVDMLAVIGPPLTISTALLVYFGWARTDAQAKAMGLDVSLFGYTVQDFVLRSIPSLFIPLVWLLILAVLWLALDRFLAGHLTAGRVAGIRRLAAVILFAGVACAAAMWLVVILQPERTVLFVPYIMAGGGAAGRVGPEPVAAFHGRARTQHCRTFPRIRKDARLLPGEPAALLGHLGLRPGARPGTGGEL